MSPRSSQHGTVSSHRQTLVAEVCEPKVFTHRATTLVHEGLRLAHLYAADTRSAHQTYTITALLSDDHAGTWQVLQTQVPEEAPEYPSLTPTIQAAAWLERYIHDMFGIVPVGHPDLRRLVHHENIPEGTHPLRKDFARNTKLPHAEVPFPMNHVTGEGIVEIPVGPIHAGIIEPGHFRFAVAGERVITLDGKLFFTHKGVEKLVEGLTAEKALPYVERVSGDTAAGSAIAYVQAVEDIAGARVPERALYLRSLVLELERITMHMHDLANIPGMGTGFTVMAAHGFRIKERMMRLSDEVFGNRFWRGFVVLGGVARDITPAELRKIVKVTQECVEEMQELIQVGRDSASLMERLEATGVLSHAAARDFGAVGVGARGSGVVTDTRVVHPYAAYGSLSVVPAIETGGDVLARFLVRAREMESALELVQQIVAEIPAGEVRVPVDAKEGSALGYCEAWRGELLYALTIEDGVLSRCSIRDPSMMNWPLFAVLTPGNIVPDFPLCNKSLNLSYSGVDV